MSRAFPPLLPEASQLQTGLRLCVGRVSCQSLLSSIHPVVKHATQLCEPLFTDPHVTPLDALLLILRAALDDDAEEAMLQACGELSEAAWDAVCTQARSEGVESLLGHTLRPHRGVLPRAPIDELERVYLGTLAHNLIAQDELDHLAQDLAVASERALVLKGVSFLRTIYSHRVGARPMSDVDLLVSPRGLQVADEALRARGYEPHPGNPRLMTRPLGQARVFFDLHTPEALTGADRVTSLANAFHLDPAAMWSRALPLDSEADPLWRPSDEDLLIHAVLHALKHGFSRLIWLFDIALLRDLVPVDRARQRAEEAGASRPLLYADMLLHLCLDRPEPPHSALHVSERLLVAQIASRETGDNLGMVLAAFSQPHALASARYLLEVLFPRREQVAVEQPGRPLWQVYVERARRLWALVRWLVRAIIP